MNRLLFAMARGARIQRRHFQVYDTKQWGDTRVVSTSIDCDFDYRIHPEDDERQYGTLSTQLRATAAESDTNIAYALANAFKTHPFLQWQSTFRDGRDFLYSAGVSPQAHPDLGCSADMHRSLFLLILAEALADEGL